MRLFITFNWFTNLLFFFFIFLSLNLSFKGSPSVGGLLNPLSGIWSNTPIQRSDRLSLKGLKEAVTIHWDSYHIPHIFAQNSEDLYFAQGYLVASDRLFQIDLFTRSGLGRVSEIINQPKAIEKDQLMISLGLREAARKKTKEIMAHPETQTEVLSYIKGINAYIDQMKNRPIEYKLLNTFPEKWGPDRVTGLMNSIGWMLAGRSQDIELTHLAKKYGFKDVEKIFSPFPHRSLPIMRDFKKKQLKQESRQDNFISYFSEASPLKSQPNPQNGSNNWAILPRLTTNLKTLFANDTHLNYSLPSIWYEVQLHTPLLNIYGGSLPGSPGITIGFNENIAWGMTNTSSDTFDWFEVEFKDETSLQYKYDDNWRMARTIIEEIKIKGKPPLLVKQTWTHHGVVYKRVGHLALVLKTTLQEPSNELKVFLDLSHSKSFSDCQRAISRFFVPAQNIICADSKNIGIWHQGLFPKRWMGQGRYILDGRRSDHDWSEWLNPENIPFEINPQRGYVHSANQLPVAPHTNLYLGSRYLDSYRALSIEQKLKEAKEYTPDKMIEIQNDAHDLKTIELKPTLLKYINRENLKPQQISTLNILQEWDGAYKIDSIAPSIFDLWYEKLSQNIWDDQLNPFGEVIYPPDSSTVKIILRAAERDPWAMKWIDNINTKKSETLEEIVTEAFSQSWDQLKDKFGNNPNLWLFGKVRKIKLKHTLNIAAFSKLVSAPGNATSINASSSSHGPSWKMVVELDKDHPRAWINYPGGPSGNPFDPKYSLFIDSWSKGKMREVYFYKSQASIKGDGYQQILRPTVGESK